MNSLTDDLETLGATLGGPQRRRDTFRSRLKVMQGMRHKLATINEPATALKLARRCLGESTVQHLLRVYGADLIPELTQAYTTIDTPLNIIATGMIDFSRQQASLGINVGGLGLRRLQDLATPAELAAELTARPKLAELSTALTIARLTTDDQLLNHLDHKSKRCKRTWRLGWTKRRDIIFPP